MFSSTEAYSYPAAQQGTYMRVRPGYQFNVIVTKDLVFQKPYAASR